MAEETDRRVSVSVDHLLEGVQIIGYDWTYLYVNHAAARHGQRTREELIGRRMMDCYPGIERTELFTRLDTVMRTRRPERMRNEFEFPDGQRGWFELLIDPVPDGICVMSMDITERLTAEARLQRSQKMAAFAQLTAGIAHDFNNLLTAVIGYSDLVLGDRRLAPDIAADIGEIKRAGERASRLTRQLLAFTRKQVLRREVLDLNRVVVEFNQMLARVIGDDIEIELHPAAGAALVEADIGQIEQIILNLVINSRDAMPQGGTIVISTSVAEDGAGERAGPYVMLTIADTGGGMTPEVKAQIFEPFFTTKPQGKGTGLGLAMVSSIVKDNGGWMTLDSTPGVGTTVRIYLPAVAPAAAVHRVGESGGRRLVGSERILVVEGEASVSKLMTRVLKDHGYSVVEAASASEAIAVAQDAKRRIDLLITDLLMPQLHGPNLAQRVINLHPAAKVLYVAETPPIVGLTSDLVHSRMMFLAKPFTTRDLVASVRDALDSAAP